MRAWTDFLQMTGTFFLTLFFSIETGLVASVVFSLILVIQKSTQTRIKIIGRLPGTEEWVPIDEDEAAQEDIPGVVSRFVVPWQSHCRIGAGQKLTY
jgi:MFS superfamily sulfate permease-like transporter